jgi:hypothetical protein
LVERRSTRVEVTGRAQQEDVVRRRALGRGDDRAPLGQLAGHVLGGMHGQIDLARDERRLDGVDPARLVADVRARVARRADLDQLDVAAQALGDPVRLRQREGAAAGSQADRAQRRRPLS